MKFRYFVLLLLLNFSINFTFSQNKTSLKNDYLWFDKQIGIENTGLFNGLRYEEKYRMENNNHKFYKTSEFMDGDIIYDDQPYYNIKMKYDLFEDQIIVNLITNSGDNILKLLNSKLGDFNLNGSEFIKLSNKITINSNEELNGIYEILSKNSNLILYKKNKKKARKIINKEYLYYTFKSDNQYYCFTNENYYLIHSKKDWIKIFPKQKKEIQSFYSKNKIMYQTNYDSFAKQLSSKLSNSNTYNLTN